MLHNIFKVREIIQRLVHIEAKVSQLLAGGGGQYAGGFAGHPDQVYGAVTYAQHGDDLIVLNIFDAIGIKNPSYLDIGAHHPINISNTALLYSRGSRGVNVEANPNLIQEFHVSRREDINLNVGVADHPGLMTFYMIDKRSGRNSFNQKMVEQFVRENPEFRITEEVQIQVVTANEIIETYCNGKFPDFLSIDVEGLDIAILKSIDYQRWSPKVICVETCGFSAEKESDLFDFLSNVGYFPMMRNRGNSFLVRNEYRLQVTGRAI